MLCVAGCVFCSNKKFSLFPFRSPARIIASELRADLGDRAPPGDVISAAKKMGFRVEFVDDLGGPAGIIVGNIIAIKVGGCDRWTQYVIGHELAHAIALRKSLPDEGPGWETTIDTAVCAALALAA